MADYTFTPANVKYVSGGKLYHGLAAVQIDAGETVFKDLSVSETTPNSVRLADANATPDSAATVTGVAMNSAEIDQPVTFLCDDPNGAAAIFEVIGASFTPGDTIILSANAGKAAPVADLAAGWMLAYVGYFLTATRIQVTINNTGLRK